MARRSWAGSIPYRTHGRDAAGAFDRRSSAGQGGSQDAAWGNIVALLGKLSTVVASVVYALRRLAIVGEACMYWGLRR